jgi:hypothetical protein
MLRARRNAPACTVSLPEHEIIRASRKISLFTQTLNVAEERQCGFDDREYGRVTARYAITSCEIQDPRRARAEAFVRARFHRTHGAHVVTFMPSLLLLTDSGGRIDAVLGCRSADPAPLFLERYLERPIEESIAASTGVRVRRSQVVEVGNFAAANSRVAGTFMSFLASYFLERGMTWIAFTATDSIRRILATLGARCADLGAANGVQVANGPDRWGSYYSHDPRVMAGYLPMARRIPALWKSCHAD